MKSTFIAIFACLILVGGIDANGQQRPLPAFANLSGGKCGKVELYSLSEAGKDHGQGLRGARFSMAEGYTEIITLDAMGASFLEDSLPNHYSPSCDLVWLGALDKGEVYNDAEKVVAHHERYYCVFVSLPRACVVAVHTGMMCSGEFDSSNKWVPQDGSSPVNFLAHALPTAQRYTGSINEREDPTLDVANVYRCDPVSRKNAKYYSNIVGDDSTEISAELRRRIAEDLEALDQK